jgi:hypothetical protein
VLVDSGLEGQASRDALRQKWGAFLHDYQPDELEWEFLKGEGANHKRKRKVRGVLVSWWRACTKKSLLRQGGGGNCTGMPMQRNVRVCAVCQLGQRPCQAPPRCPSQPRRTRPARRASPCCPLRTGHQGARALRPSGARTGICHRRSAQRRRRVRLVQTDDGERFQASHADDHAEGDRGCRCREHRPSARHGRWRGRQRHAHEPDEPTRATTRARRVTARTVTAKRAAGAAPPPWTLSAWACAANAEGSELGMGPGTGKRLCEWRVVGVASGVTK